jgi:hypothetical protein
MEWAPPAGERRNMLFALIALLVVIAGMAAADAWWHEPDRTSAPPYFRILTPSTVPYAVPTYTVPTYTVPTTTPFYATTTTVPPSGLFEAPDGAFSIVFPSEYTFSDNSGVPIGPVSLAGSGVKSALDAIPWGLAVYWSRAGVSPPTAAVAYATACTHSSERLITRTTITVDGHAAVMCREADKMNGRGTMDDYVYLVANGRAFEIDETELTTATYADFLKFVASFKLGVGSSSPASPPTSFSVQPLAGAWVNIDPNADNITRIVITGISAHPFGRCHPTECSWAVKMLSLSGNSYAGDWGARGDVLWDHLTLRLQGGVLTVTDTGGRVQEQDWSYTATFRRSAAAHLASPNALPDDSGVPTG